MLLYRGGRGGKKKQLRIDYPVVIRNIRNGTNNFNRRFSRSPSILSPSPSLPPPFFYSKRISDRKEFRPSQIFRIVNGRTISTFSELIIGEWSTRFKGWEGEAVSCYKFTAICWLKALETSA